MTAKSEGGYSGHMQMLLGSRLILCMSVKRLGTGSGCCWLGDVAGDGVLKDH